MNRWSDERSSIPVRINNMDGQQVVYRSKVASLVATIRSCMFYYSAGSIELQRRYANLSFCFGFDPTHVWQAIRSVYIYIHISVLRTRTLVANSRRSAGERLIARHAANLYRSAKLNDWTKKLAGNEILFADMSVVREKMPSDAPTCLT